MTGTTPSTSKPGQHAPEKSGMPHKSVEPSKQHQKETTTPAKHATDKK